MNETSRISMLRKEIQRELLCENNYIQKYDKEKELNYGKEKTVISDEMMVGYLRIAIQQKNQVIDSLLEGLDDMLRILNVIELDDNRKEEVKRILNSSLGGV